MVYLLQLESNDVHSLRCGNKYQVPVSRFSFLCLELLVFASVLRPRSPESLTFDSLAFESRLSDETAFSLFVTHRLFLIPPSHRQKNCLNFTNSGSSRIVHYRKKAIMKFLTSSAVCAMAISGSLAAMSLKIARGPSPPTVSRKELQGRSTITEALGNNFTGQSYIAQVTIGTPGQDISLAIDTGSSDTWVLSTTADLCTNADLQAQEESGCETPCELSNLLGTEIC